MLIGISTTTLAQTPTDLVTHQPTVAAPSGGTFEWHNALPIGVGNLMTPSQVAAAAPGLYYGVYNFSTCYSSPSVLRIATNTCPTTTVDLKTLVDSTAKPAGTVVSYHSGSPATSANIISGTAVSMAAVGTYFAAYYNTTGLCFTNASPIVVVSKSCTDITLNTPPAQTATPNQNKTGDAAAELMPTGGTGPYNYSDGSTDPACVVPMGATALPGVSITATGSYTYTAPTAPGTYYFCVKVCDNTMPTAVCAYATYKITVSCAVVGSAVPTLK